MKTKEKTEIFSISVSALYAESALGLPLKNLHRETKKDALLYINGILPLHSVVMRSIENFFNQYVSRDFDQWEQYLSVMLNDVRGFRQCCDVLLKLHMEIMVRVKKRQDQTVELKAELTNLTEEMERKKMELENSVEKQKQWAFYLLFVPGINIIASPLLYVRTNIDERRAEAEGHETKINRSALAMVDETMIPFLDIFTHSLNAVAGSCKVIEQDILSFEGKTKKVMKLHQEMHYKVMKRQSTEIKQNCTAFLNMIRKVRCDFQSMQRTSLDRSQKIWLNRQLDDITRNYPEKITGQLRNMLSYFTDATSEQTAIERNMYGKGQCRPRLIFQRCSSEVRLRDWKICNPK